MFVLVELLTTALFAFKFSMEELAMVVVAKVAVAVNVGGETTIKVPVIVAFVNVAEPNVAVPALMLLAFKFVVDAVPDTYTFVLVALVLVELDTI